MQAEECHCRGFDLVGRGEANGRSMESSHSITARAKASNLSAAAVARDWRDYNPDELPDDG